MKSLMDGILTSYSRRLRLFLAFYQNDAHLLTVGHCIAKQISLSENIVGIYNPENSMPGITLIFNASLLEGQNALAGEAKYLPGFIDKGAPKVLKNWWPAYLL